MTGQQSLLAPPPPPPPRAMIEFLSGVACRFAFGEKPTAEQKRAAARMGEELAARLVDLREAT